MRVVLFKAKWLRQLAVFVDELDTELLREVTGFHLAEKAETLDRRIAVWNQRFTDVESGEVVAFEQGDLVPALSEDRRCGGSGGAAADHNNIGLVFSLNHRTYSMAREPVRNY